MPRFIYKAKRGPGEILEGKINAENQQQAVLKLGEMGLYLLSIEEETRAFINRSRRQFIITRRIPLRDLSTFTRQLSNLLDSGLTMLNALSVLIEQTDNLDLKHTIQLLRDDVSDGAPFSSALAKDPKVFSTLYTSMVAAGEVSGALEDVLRRLSDFLEKDEETASKVRASLAYPAFMAFVGCLTIFVLLSFVAPRLTAIFVDLGQSLPLPTKILIMISSFFARFWVLIIVGIITSVVLFKRWVQAKEGKVIFDTLKLRSPVLGPFVQKVEIGRFGRTLGTLIANGVPIIQALSISARTMGNEVMRQALEEAAKEVVGGASLSKSLKSKAYFPPLMVNMVAVGEESGALERSLFKVADTYDDEIERTIKALTSLLEPALILFMGCVVGFIVISMLLPIFQLNLMIR